jgi:hypothetical protein
MKALQSSAWAAVAPNASSSAAMASLMWSRVRRAGQIVAGIS